MSYKYELIKRYYSYKYKYFIPQTIEGWNWVIERIELNFGDIFSSIQKDSVILDLACGVGYLEYYLLKKGFTRIQAIDLSEEQIDIAKERLKENQLDYNDKVSWVVVDAFECLRKDGKFDVIVMLDFLEHFSKDKIIELLQSSYDALCNGGFLIIRTVNADNPMFGHFFYHDFTHEMAFTPDIIRQCLSLTGFKVLKVDYERIPPKKSSSWIVRQVKQFIRFLGLKLLAKFLGISPAAFSQNLIVIGSK